MNWRHLIGRIVGLYYIAYGTSFVLFIAKVYQFLGAERLLPTYYVSSTGSFGYYTGSLLFFMQVIILPAGLVLVWKLKRWAAIAGIIGTLVHPLTLLILQVLISISGGLLLPLTALISTTDMACFFPNPIFPYFCGVIYAIGFFFVLPTMGIIFAWRDLH